MKSYLHFTRSLTLSILIIVLSARSSNSSTNSDNTSPPDAGPSLSEQLQIIVDDAVESGLPGVSLHVQDRGEYINVVAGVVDRITAEPVTPSSLFHAASIGKTFVATMVIRLVDMGLLQLDDPIDRWLDPSMSSMIADSDRITVEMLLAHTSGIQDYFNNPEFVDVFLGSPGRSFSPLEILGYINNTRNNFAPGAQYRYSNTNYVLAGVVAERVTGVSIEIALRQWVFEPAGLENTFGSFENMGQADTAHGYVPASFIMDLGGSLPTGSDFDSTEWLLSEGLGDAPIHSTPSDLNSFIRTLIDTDLLVSGELKSQMTTESFPGSSEHGLGLFITDDGLTYEHDGAGIGLISLMTYTPSEDRSFATIINGSHGIYEDLARQYMAKVYMVLDPRQ